jgi:cytochrome c553
MTFRSTLLALGMGLMAAVTMAQVQAQTAPAAAGDKVRGKIVADTCNGCHGIPHYKNVYPTYDVPKLGGQRASYIVSALGAYASGQRSHPTMHAQASSLSPQDRADIAAYFASQPPQTTAQPVGTPPQATQLCAACHGPTGMGVDNEANQATPRLAGQYADYIERALHDYKSGKRKNPIMGGIAQGLKEEEIPALAEFFSHQTRLCTINFIRINGKCPEPTGP